MRSALARQQMVIANNALRGRGIWPTSSRTRNRAQALSANGSFLMAVKKYDLALQQFEAALQIDPDSPHLNNNFAWFLANCPGSPVRQSAASGANWPKRRSSWCPMRARSGIRWESATTGPASTGRRHRGPANDRPSCSETPESASTPCSWPWRIGNSGITRKPIDSTIPPSDWMRDNHVADEELLRFCREAAEVARADTDVEPNRA